MNAVMNLGFTLALTLPESSEISVKISTKAIMSAKTKEDPQGITKYREAI
jgi:hypothetical protein